MMLTEWLGIEMVYIFISFWGKNYLKKSSDLAFLIDFSHFDGFELEFFSTESTPKQFVCWQGMQNELINALMKFFRFWKFLYFIFEGFVIRKRSLCLCMTHGTVFFNNFSYFQCLEDFSKFFQKWSRFWYHSKEIK